MKKILLSLATLALGASAVFAQSAPFISGVTFSAPGQEKVDPEEDIYELPTPEVTISMEFDGWNDEEATKLGYAPKLMVATGMGFGVEPMFYDLESKTSTFTFTMNEETWGQPYMGMLNAVLMVCFMDDDMDFYVTEDGEPVFYQAIYTAPNTFAARFEYAAPNGLWEDETFADAYNRGEVSFVFSNPVQFANPEEIGTISYFIDDVEIPVEITEYTSEWDMLNGLWAVTFKFSNEEFMADDLSQIVIELSGVESVIGETPITVQPLVLSNVASPAPRKIKKAMEGDLTSGNELVNVYNVQGTLVKESVNKSAIKDLPAGLYIVDGKKYVVR